MMKIPDYTLSNCIQLIHFGMQQENYDVLGTRIDSNFYRPMNNNAMNTPE